MIHEIRRYRIKAGKVKEYLKFFEEVGWPIVRRYQNLVGFWTCHIGELNIVTHLWVFEDEKTRLERYDAMRSDPEYIAVFRERAMEYIDDMHAEVLVPAPFSPDLTEVSGMTSDWPKPR
jgi:hypothetical protein